MGITTEQVKNAFRVALNQTNVNNTQDVTKEELEEVKDRFCENIEVLLDDASGDEVPEEEEEEDLPDEPVDDSPEDDPLKSGEN